MTAVRHPAVAGQFYAGDEAGLSQQIEAAFSHELGPGEIPESSTGDTDLVGIISPHAGYPYSGPVAAHGFAALARAGRPDVAVIVGPNHSGVGEAVAVSEADEWGTPLGPVPIQTGLRDRLLEVDSTHSIIADERTHAGEHSIEVQVPFLQYLYDDPVPILPIAMTRQDEETARDLGKTLATVLDGFEGDAVVIASTDLTHYEPQSVAAEKDHQVVETIEAVDVSLLYRTIETEDVSMCGYGPTAAGMTLARDRGATGSLLKYATSGDTGGPPEEVVGYASVTFGSA